MRGCGAHGHGDNHDMASYRRTLAASAFALTLALGGAACSDEDGDGAVTDEEIGEIDDKAGDLKDEAEQEMNQGRDEAE